MVLRTFPIRVAGQQAGPMFEEIDWEMVRKESGSPHRLEEFTTVTGKLRRVGRFDLREAARAARINGPTQIALNFVDYLAYSNCGITQLNGLSREARKMVEEIESAVGVPVTYLGTGPALQNTVVRGTPSRRSSALIGDLAHSNNSEEKLCRQILKVI